MHSDQSPASVLSEAPPCKVYGNSALRAARHFFSVASTASTLALAEDLLRRPEIEVVAVLDGGGLPLGLVQRAKLFGLLGKPFGREILGRTQVSEVSEPAPSLDMHAGIFSIAGETLDGKQAHPYRILVNAAGAFVATLSARDLADYLSRITQDDIELAGQIQDRLSECVENPGDERFSFGAWSRAAKGVGGDFWYARRLADGKVFLSLCDVSGKGLSASLVVSMVWGMLLMYDYSRGLRDLIASLNESLVTTFRLERYLTGFFAIFDPGTGHICVADMGHSHSLLVRKGKALRLVSKAGNLPVGIEGDLEPKVEEWRLQPGDSLLVYSDGLTEQEGAQGEEFGEARLAAVLARALARGDSLASVLPARIDAFRADLPQQDDMSFMLLGFQPEKVRARQK